MLNSEIRNTKVLSSCLIISPSWNFTETLEFQEDDIPDESDEDLSQDDRSQDEGSQDEDGTQDEDGSQAEDGSQGEEDDKGEEDFREPEVKSRRRKPRKAD